MSGTDEDIMSLGKLPATQITAPPPKNTPKRPTRYRHRWTVLSAIFGSQLLNYVDRTAIALAAPLIIAEYGFSSSTWGWILGFFFIGYVPFCFIGGWAADKFGVRKVLYWAVTVWSIFTAATAAGFSFISFAIIRMFFGVGEGPIAPWVPSAVESPLGGAIGVPIAVGLMAYFESWRATFIVLGAVGLLVAVGCWVLVRDHPSMHPWSSAAEIEEMRIEDERVAARFVQEDGTSPDSFRDYIFRPILWACAFSWFGVIWLLYTFLNWFPLFLIQEHGVDLKGLAIAGSVPWLAGTLGLFMSGLFFDALTKRFGKTPFTPRKWAIVASVLLAGGLLPFVGVATSAHSAMVLMAVVLFIIYTPLGQMNSLIASFVPKSVYGSVIGFALLIGNFAGILSPIVIGHLLETSFGWAGIFLLAGIVAVVPAIALAFCKCPTNQLAKRSAAV